MNANDLIVVDYQLQWVPDALAHDFIEDAVGIYLMHQYENEMPDIRSLVIEMGGYIMEIASCHETAGEDIEFFDKQMKELRAEDQSELYHAIMEQCFDEAFEDIRKILNFNRFTYVHELDFPRIGLSHYCKEVW